MKKLIILFFIAYSLSAESATIDDFLNYLQPEFIVSDKSDIFFQMLLATDGCRVSVNESRIELYMYDINNPEYKSYMETAKEIAESLSQAFGLETFVFINKNFLMSMSNRNERLIELFLNFNPEY